MHRPYQLFLGVFVATLTSAYRQLGIEINGGEARSAWSAVNEAESIVAITVWTDELQRDPKTGIYFLDTRWLRDGDQGAWRSKRGNLQRLRHLQIAINWGGAVRIVKVRPKAGETHEERHAAMTESDPWLYKGQPVEARVVFFDGVDFRVEIDPAELKKA